MDSEFVPRRSLRLHLLHTSSCLIQLNSEIWRLILNKLTQKEALNLRFVNKDFNHKVINLFEGWSIRLDEKCPYLNMMLDLRIKKLSIHDCFKTPVPNRPTDILLKYPDPLSQLSIIVSKTSGEIVHILLRSKNLKSIYIRLIDLPSQDEFWRSLDHQIDLNFPELIALDILICLYDELAEGNLYERLMSSRMPKLKSLAINWEGFPSQATGYRILSALITFMGHNGKNLKHFSFMTSLQDDDYNFISFPRLPPLDESPMILNCSSLETFSVYGGTLNNTWKRLLSSRSKLIDIIFCRDDNHYKNFAISNTLCATICSNNFETLRKIHITDIKIDGVRVGEIGRFDMSMFGNCANLMELKLCCKNTSEVEINNLSFLPGNIQSLSTQCFLIPSQDLATYLHTPSCLVYLTVDYAGCSGRYGFNVYSLLAIKNHGTLKQVCISKKSVNRDHPEFGEFKRIFYDLCAREYSDSFNYITKLKLYKSGMIWTV